MLVRQKTQVMAHLGLLSSVLGDAGVENVSKMTQIGQNIVISL